MARLKSGMLVAAALRYASQELIDCVLVRRGEADAGAIFIHINAGLDQHKILARILDFDGAYSWQAITGAGWVDAETARARLDREIGHDPDAFVLAVDDPKGRNPFAAI
ncbi:MAG: DUF1491 family protein [Candidatus Puniceispirillum sp.]|jgi:hypothetical protein|uniref:DUF1491 family protein n=1 Tax=Candidatus Puniceispirillum sp. TaxID=2026719 RepID=UPI001EC84BA7|nr:DUF1491 family protein [Candidatus Puniceispirillum sp.]MBT6416483.1 DUF1491 family protein [Candidatus Puniceispirillum sp.]MBT6565776.1 DUF1491 family protein [Candidatus Puniceispirillum sp.]